MVLRVFTDVNQERVGLVLIEALGKTYIYICIYTY